MLSEMTMFVIPEVAKDILLVAFGTLVGGFVGYRFGVTGERRKEYNEIADRLFLNVNIELESTAAMHFRIDESDISLIRRRMGWLHCRRFDQAVAAYENAARNVTEQDEHGEFGFADAASVNQALQHVAELLKRK